jgi:MtfA peptidase
MEIIVAVILFPVLFVLYTVIAHTYDSSYYRKVFAQVASPDYRNMLIKNSIIYRNLGLNDRIKFEKRIVKFLRTHNFNSADKNIEIGTDLKILIAATAIQVTYGYPDVYLRYFKEIIIFDEEYQSQMTGNLNEGEVNTLGAIVLSKKNIEIGFNDPADGRNLLLHEFAHALMLDNIFGPEFSGFFDSDEVYRFQQLALNEIDLMNQGSNSFFREYGATNFQEFFAVAVECFFEQTTEFMKYDPDLFNSLCRLLNLNVNSLIGRTNCSN